MKTMVLNADKLLSDSAEVVKRQLISVSNISELFYKNSSVKNGLYDEILEYFEAISNVRYYEKNQFFWLQYAMACLDAKEYKQAKNNFDIAYRLASEKQLEGEYQIDVQYARYLLENGLETNLDEVDVFKVYKEAHRKFYDVFQNKSAQEYFVSKQMSLYKDFIYKYANKFSGDNFNKANSLIDSFIIAMNRYKYKGRNTATTSDAIRKLYDCKDILFQSRGAVQ